MNFEKLPFVKVAENGRVVDTWDVTPSGDYTADCLTGVKYFRELMLVMTVTTNPLLLSRVLHGQAAKHAQWGGIEAGFHAALADEVAVET
jgi:hypothetical protein